MTMVGVLLSLLLVLSASTPLHAADPASEDPIGRTPPRLSYTSGDVSFWRPGAADWAPGQINTPLAPGDQLYTSHGGTLEVQIGGRAFVRAWGDTQLGLANQEPDFLQLTVTTGHISLDLRTVEPGRTVEVATPHAAVTIERAGYYRVTVTPDRTSLITRRSGSATVTPAGGQAITVAASEEIIVDDAATPVVQSYVGPEMDVWDRWNYARTDALLESVSARYVPAEVSGVDDLDHHGTWRVVSTYGPVWVPHGVAAGWAPYSAGRWIWDPYYGWTWVDAAPWGWVPYHYGRWVFVNGYWAWAPGPLVRPVYAPALVAFLEGPGLRVSVGGPAVAWVALGWGEPCVPWWGPPRFVGRPWWGGWGGPRVVNNVVVNQTTVVNVTSITTYQHLRGGHAVVAVREDDFRNRRVPDVRIRTLEAQRLEPMRGPLRIAPEPSSLVAATGPAVRPPEQALARPVVATRPPVSKRIAPPGGAPADTAPPGVTLPAPRIVSPPKTAPPATLPSRPPFGVTGPERRVPSPAPAPQDSPRQPEVGRPLPTPPREAIKSPTPAIPSPEPRRPTDALGPERRLPTPGPAPQASPRQPGVVRPEPPAPREAIKSPVPAIPSPEPRRPTDALGPERRLPSPAPTPQASPRQPEVGRPVPPAPREVIKSPAPTIPSPAARPPERVPAREVPPIQRGEPVPAPGPPAVPSPAPGPAPVQPLPGEPANRLFPGRGDLERMDPGLRREPMGPSPGSRTGPSREPTEGRRPAERTPR